MMVSVIMPTYNRAALIGECIDSVLCQSYGDLELIVIDDGSTDETRSIIENYTDPRIHYYPLEHCGFIGKLRNFGIQQSRGGLIAFLDSDDIWQPGKLEKQVTLLQQHTDAGFSISDVTLFEGSEIVRQHVYHRQDGFEITSVFEALKKNQFGIYPSTFIFKRSCLEQTGMLHEHIRSADFNFNIRMAYYHKALIVYEPLVLRRIHVSNRHSQFPVQNYRDYIATYDFLYQNKMIAKKYLNLARSTASFKIGDIHLERGERTEARKNYLKALRFKPFFPQCYRRILSSYLKA